VTAGKYSTNENQNENMSPDLLKQIYPN